MYTHTHTHIHLSIYLSIYIHTAETAIRTKENKTKGGSHISM